MLLSDAINGKRIWHYGLRRASQRPLKPALNYGRQLQQHVV